MDALVLAAYALCLFANLADWWTTIVALQHGFIEKNPIARLFLTKSPILNAFVKGGIVPIAGVALVAVDPLYSVIFNGIVGTGIAVTAARNYVLLRKNKISLK